MTDLLTVQPGTPRASGAALSVPFTETLSVMVGHRQHAFDFELPLPEWFDGVVLRLQELHRFQPGWDGQNAEPMSAEVTLIGLTVLQMIAREAVPAPQLVLSPQGGLQYEWHQGGWDVEIEIHGDGTVESWTRELATSGERWFEGLIDVLQTLPVLTTLG